MLISPNKRKHYSFCAKATIIAGTLFVHIWIVDKRSLSSGTSRIVANGYLRSQKVSKVPMSFQNKKKQSVDLKKSFSAYAFSGIKNKENEVPPDSPPRGLQDQPVPFESKSTSVVQEVYKSCFSLCQRAFDNSDCCFGSGDSWVSLVLPYLNSNAANRLSLGPNIFVTNRCFPIRSKSECGRLILICLNELCPFLKCAIRNT